MTEAPSTDALDRFPLLAGLGEDERAAVRACLEPRHASPGEVLVRQGEPSEGLWLVLSGQVSVVLEGDPEHEVAVLGPRTFFGEMSLVAAGPARATVRAVTDAELAVLPASRAAALDTFPELRDALEDTARRRRAANRVVELEPVEVALGELAVALRPLWPDDWRLMLDSLERTSQESLRRRFFSVPNLSEHTMRRLARVDWTDHFAWAVLEGGVDGPLVAVGRYGRFVDEPEVVEVALLVADDLHGRGIGRLLVQALVVAAAHHPGVTTFSATALAENTAVRGLLEAYGAAFGPGERSQEVTSRWPVAEAVARVDPDLRAQLEPLVHAVLSPS